jgi:hypothetical protein
LKSYEFNQNSTLSKFNKFQEEQNKFEEKMNEIASKIQQNQKNQD